MRKFAAQKYNPRIGHLIVNFLEYFRKHEEESTDYWDLDEALKFFGESENLKPIEVHGIATQLYSQGYPIDPVQFHPEYNAAFKNKQEEISFTDKQKPEDKQHSVFEEYRNAILRKEYDKAHMIFESMTPSQKEIIRDRRAKMNEKLDKKAESTAALEKEIPVVGDKVEDVKLTQESPIEETQELDELIGPAEDLVENHHSLNLPPQSMTVFLPFAHALDDFKHVREQKRLGKATQEEVRKKTLNFLFSYGKVLNYLDKQGFDIAELKNMVKQYANLYFMQPTATMANLGQRLLVLATNLQKKGLSDLAKSLMMVAAHEGQWREFEDAWSHIEVPAKEDEEKSVDIAEEAGKIVQEHLGELGVFLDLLKQEKYDEARAVYLGLSPEQRLQAHKLAQQHFAATNILSLHKVGESLFNKGKYAEAHEISQIIKSQFTQLPIEDQKEVILLILPADEKLEFLPQVFKDMVKKDETDEVETLCDKMDGMKCRLNPIISTQTIQRLLKLADDLDEKGQGEFADKITDWLEQEVEREKTPKRDVGVAVCSFCSRDIYYDKSMGRPKFCSNCGKGTWGVGKVASEKIPGGLDDGMDDSEFDEEQLEKGIEVEYEHTDEREIAKEIAKDHLVEGKDYYKYLEEMEKEMEEAEKEGEEDKKEDIEVEDECPCPETGPAHDGRGRGEGMCEKRRGLEEKVPGGGKRWRATKVSPPEAIVVVRKQI